MKYTEQEIELLAKKAAKWDALAQQIASCYGDEDEHGNEVKSKYELETGSEPDLMTIGEMAASAFGWL